MAEAQASQQAERVITRLVGVEPIDYLSGSQVVRLAQPATMGYRYANGILLFRRETEYDSVWPGHGERAVGLAELDYPLLVGWFASTDDLPSLLRASCLCYECASMAMFLVFENARHGSVTTPYLTAP